ncbi:MAG: hypothetical protein DDG59_10325 [Anaerolineae bacterium]|jgi:hypothetical protein|nr:MAG: hypothetical protein DDG59_10325 [Anaerolineae bacterium]
MALWKPTCAVKSEKSHPLAKRLWLFILSLFLSGCVSLYDPESSHEWHVDHLYTLRSGELATQTIDLRQASLSKISLWITPAETAPPDAKLTLRLFHLTDKPNYLFTITQPLSTCHQGKCTFLIPKNQYLPRGNYALVIESSVTVHLWGNRLDSYPSGNLTVNHQASSADLAFSLEYRYTLQSFLIDLIRFGKDFWIVFPALAFFITPGFVILKLLRLPLPDDPSLTLYIVISTSIALLAVGMAWTSLFNLHWQGNFVRFLFYGGFLGIAILAMRNFRTWLVKLCIADFLLVLIVCLALFIRLLMTRNLAAPAWVDSVHHALITELILQYGAYPSSYTPYLNLTTTSYHSGYHANLAFFTWLSGLPVPKSMLVFGQILNALAVYSAYTFAHAFYRHRSVGLVAATLVAFFSPMPAYYTSWGRYTQLCGMLILPTLIYLFNQQVVPRLSHRLFDLSIWLLLVALLFSGLIIIHYRVSYFFALLLFPSALAKLSSAIGISDKQRWGRLTFSLLIFALLTLFFSAPWLPEAFVSLLLPKFRTWTQTPTVLETIPLGLLTPALGKIVLALAALGFAIELLRHSRSGLVLAIWMGLCFATIYLTHFISRGIGFLNMTSVTISLYLPLSALGAQGTALIFQWLRRLFNLKSRWLSITLSLCAILISAFLGGRTLIPLLNPITMLVRSDDLKAMNFIRTATPIDQSFLIQPFLWGYGLYAGQDGGAWIPALAHRPTIPPPVLFALSDQGEQVRQINQISQRVLEKPRDAAYIAKIMSEQGLAYLYLGAKGGSISAWEISQSPAFEQIYHEGGVFIFRLLHPQSHP